MSDASGAPLGVLPVSATGYMANPGNPRGSKVCLCSCVQTCPARDRLPRYCSAQLRFGGLCTICYDTQLRSMLSLTC